MAGRGSTLPLACSVLRRASWAGARSRTSRTQHAWVQQAGIEQDGVERARVEQAFSVCVRTAHAHLHADALGRTESCCLAARLGVPTPVESCQIVGQSCQGKFDSHVRQTSCSELTHPALLFPGSTTALRLLYTARPAGLRNFCRIRCAGCECDCVRCQRPAAPCSTPVPDSSPVHSHRFLAWPTPGG